MGEQSEPESCGPHFGPNLPAVVRMLCQVLATRKFSKTLLLVCLLVWLAVMAARHIRIVAGGWCGSPLLQPNHTHDVGITIPELLTL